LTSGPFVRFLYVKGVPHDLLVHAFGLSHVTVRKHACDPATSTASIHRRQPKE
jgi:hypothetical protein